MRPTGLIHLAVLGFVTLFGTVSARGQIDFTIVARTGQAAGATGANYDALSTPYINTSGQVAFGASLSGAGVNAGNNMAIFAGAPDSPAVTVRSGMAVPGAAPGFTLGPLTDPFYFPAQCSFGFNKEGHVLFEAPLAGPGIDPSNSYLTQAYYLAGAGSLQTVASAADSHVRPLLTAGDVVAYFGNDGVKVWSPGNANPNPVGNPVERAVISPNGELAFLGSDDAGFGIQAGTPGDIHAVMTAGDVAPGTAAPAHFASALFPSINKAGMVAFHAYINSDGNPNPQYDESIWIGKAGSLGMVARQGEIAPGTGGRVYAGFEGDIDTYRTPAISGAGEAAFAALLRDSGDNLSSGLFAGKPGQVRVVALEGDHANNAPAGFTVGELRIDSPLTINSRGQVAFGDRSGVLYVDDPAAGLLLVAGVGLPFQLGPGDVRMISEIDFNEIQAVTGGEDGRAFGFNDAGQLTFGMKFTDGTSAVVITAVPEPLGVGVVGMLVAVMGRGRASRRR